MELSIPKLVPKQLLPIVKSIIGSREGQNSYQTLKLNDRKQEGEPKAAADGEAATSEFLLL